MSKTNREILLDAWQRKNLVITGLNDMGCQEIEQAFEALTEPYVMGDLEIELDVMREAGWSVAAHNDYRQDGRLRVFWLFTHPGGRWLKAEGDSDLEAVSQVSSIIESGYLKP